MRSSLDMLRIWAAITGIALVGWIVLQAILGNPVPEFLPMVIVSISGFELSLFCQDIWRKWERRRG